MQQLRRPNPTTTLKRRVPRKMSEIKDALDLLDEELPEEPGPDWNCSNCGRSFSTERALKMHQKKDHGLEDPFV